MMMNWVKPLTLQGNLVTLVPLLAEHGADLIEAASDGELWKLWYAAVPSPDEMTGEIARRLKLQQQGSMLPFTVIENCSKRPIGMTTYMDIMEHYKRLEIGWTWYRKSAQKTAINTEAKLLLLTHAFETFQCVSVRFATNIFNHNSRRAIERLGAKYEGTLRNHRIMRNGTVCDSCTYSITHSDWPAVKANLNDKLAQYNHRVIKPGSDALIYSQNKDQFTISIDKKKLDLGVIHHFLSTSYWAQNRTLKQVEHSIENSYCFGVYTNDALIGFARVITDFSTFAYLADVFILPEYQGQGLGKWLLHVIVEAPKLKDIEKWMLLTNDAHHLYEHVDFQIFPVLERVMVKIKC